MIASDPLAAPFSRLVYLYMPCSSEINPGIQPVSQDPKELLRVTVSEPAEESPLDRLIRLGGPPISLKEALEILKKVSEKLNAR